MSSHIECSPPVVVADLAREELLVAHMRACALAEEPAPPPESLAPLQGVAVAWRRLRLGNSDIIPSTNTAVEATDLVSSTAEATAIESLVACIARDRVQLLRVRHTSHMFNQTANGASSSEPLALWEVVGCPLRRNLNEENLNRNNNKPSSSHECGSASRATLPAADTSRDGFLGEGGEPLTCVATGPAHVAGVSFRVAVGSSSGRVRVLKGSDGSCLFELMLGPTGSPVTHLSFCPSELPRGLPLPELPPPPPGTPSPDLEPCTNEAVGAVSSSARRWDGLLLAGWGEGTLHLIGLGFGVALGSTSSAHSSHGKHTKRRSRSKSSQEAPLEGASRSLDQLVVEGGRLLVAFALSPPQSTQPLPPPLAMLTSSAYLDLLGDDIRELWDMPPLARTKIPIRCGGWSSDGGFIAVAGEQEEVEVHRIASLLTSSLPNKQTGSAQGVKPRARLSLSSWPASLGFALLSPQDAHAKAVADAEQAAAEAAAAAEEAAAAAATGAASSGRSGKSGKKNRSSSSTSSSGGSSGSRAAASSRSVPVKPAHSPLFGCIDIRGVLRCWDTRTWDLAVCADVSNRPFRPDRHHTGSGSGENISSASSGGRGGANGNDESSGGDDGKGSSDSGGGGGGASLHWLGPRRACVGELLGGSISVLDVVTAEAITDARRLARDAIDAWRERDAEVTAAAGEGENDDEEVDGVLLPPSDATKRRRAAAARARERAWRAVCTAKPVSPSLRQPSQDRSEEGVPAAGGWEIDRVSMPPLALLALLPLPQSSFAGSTDDSNNATVDATATDAAVAAPSTAVAEAKRKRLLDSLKCRVVASGCLSAHGGGCVRSLAGHYLAEAEYPTKSSHTTPDGQPLQAQSLSSAHSGSSSSSSSSSAAKVGWGEACLLSLGSDERAMLWTLPPDLDAEGIVAQPIPPPPPPPSASAPAQYAQPRASMNASTNDEDLFPLQPSAALPANDALAGAAPVPVAVSAPLEESEPGSDVIIGAAVDGNKNLEAENKNEGTTGFEVEEVRPPEDKGEALATPPPPVAAAYPVTATGIGNNNNNNNNNNDASNGNNNQGNDGNGTTKPHRVMNSTGAKEQEPRQSPRIGLAGALVFGLGRHDRCSGGGWPSVDWRGAASLEVALVLAGDAPAPGEEAKSEEEAAARAVAQLEGEQNNDDAESHHSSSSSSSSSSGDSSVHTSDAFDDSDGNPPPTPQLVKRFRPACVLVAGAGGRDIACYALPRPPAPHTMVRPPATAVAAESADNGETPQGGNKSRSKSKGKSRGVSGGHNDGSSSGEGGVQWAHPGGGQRLGGYGGHGAAITAMAQAPWRCGASSNTIDLNLSTVGGRGSSTSSSNYNDDDAISMKRGSMTAGQQKGSLTTEELIVLNNESNGYEWFPPPDDAATPLLCSGDADGWCHLWYLKWIDREGLRASTSQQPPLPCEAVCVAKWQQHYAPVVSVNFATTAPVPRNTWLKTPPEDTQSIVEEKSLQSAGRIAGLSSSSSSLTTASMTTATAPTTATTKKTRLSLNPLHQNATGRKFMAQRPLSSLPGWGLAVNSCDQTGRVATITLPCLDFQPFSPFTLKDVTCGWAAPPEMPPGAPLVGCSARARALLAYTPGDPALNVICSLPSLPRGAKQASLVTGLAVALDIPSSLPVATTGEVPRVSVAWCDSSGGVFVWHRGATHTIVQEFSEVSSHGNEVKSTPADIGGVVKDGEVAATSAKGSVSKLCCGVAWGDSGGDSSGGSDSGWQSSSDGKIEGGGGKIGEGLPRWLVAWGRHNVAVFERNSAPTSTTASSGSQSSGSAGDQRRSSVPHVPAAAYVLCHNVTVRSCSGTGGAVKVAALRPGRLCVVTIDGWCFDFDLALFP